MAKWQYVYLIGAGDYGVRITFPNGSSKAWSEFIHQVYNIRDEDIEVGKRFIQIPGADLIDLLGSLGRRGWEIAGVSQGQYTHTVFLKRLIPEEGADQ